MMGVRVPIHKFLDNFKLENLLIAGVFELRSINLWPELNLNTSLHAMCAVPSHYSVP